MNVSVPTRLLLTGLGAAMAGGVVYQAIGRRADARRFPPPGRLIDVGGFRLHVNCQGHGQPAVLFESGVASSSLSWRLVQDDVAAFTRACAYDRAGLAWSDQSPRPRTFSGLVDDLALVVDEVAPDAPVILVAHSFGTLVARGFAWRHPRRLAGLVLVDPVHEEEWAVPSRTARYLLGGGVWLSRVGIVLASVGVVRGCLSLLARGRTSVPQAVGRSFGRRAYALMTRMVGQISRLPADTVEAIRAHWCQPGSFQSMARHLSVLPVAAGEVRPLVLSGTLPVVVLTAGLNRDGADAAVHERLARQSARGTHRVVPDAGHWIQIDRPDAVVQAVRDLIAHQAGRALS
jgi:pimeloyl-ACP methyl ester carboxylesterase